jgi:Flp pilus assembly protein TadD
MGRKLSAGEVSSYWTGRALDYIKSQPAAWMGLMVRKLALAVNSSELPDTESPSVYAEHSWLLRVLGPFRFSALFALSVFGAVLTARSWRRLCLFYVFGRYRFPMVPMLALLAAGGIGEGARRWRAHGRTSLWPAAAAATVALMLAYLPLDDSRGAKATHYLNIAIALARNPATTDDAMAYYKRALDEAPPFPPAQFGIGVLLSRQGRAQEAIGYYKTAVEAWPNYAEARYDLGLALGEVGRWEEAAAEQRAALAIRPDDVDTRLAYGKALTALQRPAEAVEQYRAALRMRPRDVTALVGSGVALTQLGQAEEAMRQYATALEIDPASASAHNNLGWTLATAGRIADAVPHFERALEIDPRYESARANLDQARRALARR